MEWVRRQEKNLGHLEPNGEKLRKVVHPAIEKRERHKKVRHQKGAVGQSLADKKKNIWKAETEKEKKKVGRRPERT